MSKSARREEDRYRQTLVVIQVAGHAVYVGKDYSEAAHESSWYLEDYQKIPGETPGSPSDRIAHVIGLPIR